MNAVCNIVVLYLRLESQIFIMSDESEDEIGAITSSIRKRNKKSLILSDDSEDENAEKFRYVRLTFKNQRIRS